MNLPVQSRRLPVHRVRPARPEDWMLAQLPMGMQEDEFLLRFLRIFQDVADGLMHHADALPHLADLAVAPPVMIRFLASWTGNDAIDERMDETFQRRMVGVYGASLRWRGTERGLREKLQLLVGPDIEIEDRGRVSKSPIDGVGHVAVRTPSSPFVSDEDLGRMIRAEVPAAATVTVTVGSTIVYDDLAPDRVEDGEG